MKAGLATAMFKADCQNSGARQKLADGQKSYGNIFGCSIDGPVISVGVNISYKPISSKDESRLRNFGKKVLTGIFQRPMPF